MKQPSESADFTSFPLELEAIYATAPIGMCVLDRNLRYIRINQHLAEINGVAAADHIGRTVREIVPNLADEVEPMFRRVLETGEPLLNVELTGETAAQPGVLRTWIESWTALRNAAGEIVGINVVAEEVTERKRLEAELVASEQRFRTLADTAPAMLWVTDVDMQCTFLSQGWYDYTGQTEAEGLGMGWLRAVHPDDQFNTSIVFGDANMRHEPFQLMYRLRHKAGHYRWAVDAGRPRFGENGELIGYIGSVIDIHQTRLAEEELRRNQSRLQLAIHTARMVAWEWDAVNDVVTTTGNFKDIYGLSAIEHAAQGFNLLHPDDRDRHQSVVQSAAAEMKGYQSTFRIIRPDTGEIVWLEERAQIHRPPGQPARMIGVAQDITDRKEIEERLTVLQDVTAAFSRASTPQAVADVIVNQAVQAWGGHIGILVRLMDDSKTLELLSNSPLSVEELGYSEHMTLDQALPITDAIRTREPLFLETPAEIQAAYPTAAAVIITSSKSHALTCLPLRVGSRILGGISIRFPQARSFTEDDKSFMKLLAEMCAQALERAELNEKAKIAATIQERQRLARDLHDAVAQTLTAVSLLAESVPRLWERSPERALEVVRQVFKLIQLAQAELRTLLWELRPEAIVKTKATDLLRQLVQVLDGRHGMTAKLVVESSDEQLPESVHIALYRIAQESLNNILKHSQAHKVQVHYRAQAGGWTLHVSDDGRGFDLTQPSGGLGMSTMRERAASIGAELQIQSAVGQGTQLVVTWAPPP